MKLIHPHCREHLTGEDLHFLGTVLAGSQREEKFLAELLNDTAARDEILDNRLLVDAIQDSPCLLRISTCLYFYILVRNGFRQHGIGSREAADYVAELLAEFSELRRTTRPVEEMDRAFEYLVDIMQAAAEHPRDPSGFVLHCHLGNYALFLSGLYPDRIRERERRRAAPGISYYESLGRAGFSVASAQPLALEFELRSLLADLSSGFHDLRLALNDIANRVLFLRLAPT
jgi:hypothetical protein